METMRQPIAPLLIMITLAAVPGARLASAAPVYGLGQVGTFGNPELWAAGTALTMSASTQQLTSRFTANEEVEVDRVYQYFASVPSGTTVRVGIQADAGGVPSGTYLASGVVDPVDGSAAVGLSTFDTSVALNPGSVYHVVSQTETFSGATHPSYFIYGAFSNSSQRPYDRKLDANFQSLHFTPGHGWINQNRDPVFFFANNADTNIVAGPGNPYTDLTWNTNISFGNAYKAGQVFMVTDNEAPAGVQLAMRHITLNAIAAADVPLIIRVRDMLGNVLASTQMLPSQADVNGGNVTLLLDQPALLTVGTQYVITTEMNSTSGNYNIRHVWSPTPGSTAAGWGGINLMYPVRNGGGNTWLPSHFVPINPLDSGSQTDMIFSFTALVPEPASLLSAAVIVGLAAVRRPGRGRGRGRGHERAGAA